MKHTQKTLVFAIPDGVSFKIKSRKVEVKGPRGVLKLDFTHVAIDIYFEEGSNERKVVCDKYFTGGKTTASLRTVVSHMKNAITGVTKGFQYKMRFVYAHFPINVSITNGGKRVEIRNFLGEKVIRVIDCLAGARPAPVAEVDAAVTDAAAAGAAAASSAAVRSAAPGRPLPRLPPLWWCWRRRSGRLARLRP
jgi:large subunit ribosomal protein L9e